MFCKKNLKLDWTIELGSNFNCLQHALLVNVIAFRCAKDI